MTATLRAPIGQGAVGTAHRGILELSTGSGKSLSRPCLVKLAFGDKARTALEHEFAMYQLLAQKNVYAGIIRVHGLFRDTQTDAIALLMDYGGYSLRRREYELDKEFDQQHVAVEESERAIILQALKHIHSAGICHNDVRIDNIIVNHKNEVAFIDFDRARFPRGPIDYEKEIKELYYVVRCAETSESEISTDEESVLGT